MHSSEGSPGDRIDTVAALERVIGKTPPPIQLKVIDHLDDSARRWIALSLLMFAGFSAGGELDVTLAGGAPGFAEAGAQALRLPLAALDDPQLALATTDAAGRTDLSPKGDPAGAMVRAGQDRLWFADRPGNRRADSFRNLIEHPRLAAALLAPGARQIAVVRGTARLTTDEPARASFAVQGKTPLLVGCVEDLELQLRPSLALERAGLWPLGARAEGFDPAKMLVAHVRLNRDKGAGARLAGAMLSIPGLMQKGLEKDYKSNLY